MQGGTSVLITSPNDTTITASAQNFVFDTGGNLTVPGGVTAASVTTPGSGGDITMTGGNITGGNNIVISGNIGGPGYNAPNFIQFNSTDPGFSIGAFADDVGNVNGNYWVQAQFEGNGGGNSLTRGFRLYDNSANTYPFAVDGTGTAYVPGTVNTGAVYSTGTVTGSTIVTAPVALGSLTLVAGARAIINDGNLVAAGNFGAQVAGGAGNTVPVWSDGTNWYIG